MTKTTCTNKTFDNVSELMKMYGEFIEHSQTFYFATSSAIQMLKKKLENCDGENLSEEKREILSVLEPVADYFLAKSFEMYKESLKETRAKHEQVVEYLEEVVLPSFEAEADSA